MDIDVKKSMANLKEVTVTVDSTTINLGLLNEEECKELAAKLSYAVYELID